MNSSHLPLRRAAALSAILLLLTAALASCGDKGGDTPGPAPVESVTLPSLNDPREPTMTVKYEERLATAFKDRAPTPATDLTYTVTDAGDGVVITGYTGGEVVVILPSEIEEKPVVGIAERAFAGRGALSGLSIPDTVVDMAPGALAGCVSLATLRTPMAAATGETHFGSLFGAETYETNGAYVPNTLTTLILSKGTTVAPYAFYDCAFEAVGIPESVTSVGAFAFYGCDKLAYIPLGKTALTSVGERAFTGCASLLSLELPATVEGVGFGLLEGCGKLETLTLPFVGAGKGAPADAEDGEDVETEDEDALSTDHLGYIFGAKAYVHSAGYIPASLMTVTLHEGCGDIPPNAFFECAAIREVILPAGVTVIGHRAFYGCERLSKMVLPDSVTTLGDDAFHGCIRLVDLKVGAGVTTLGVQVFMDCLSLKSVTLPGSVTALPNATFAGCRSLESVTAPGVTEIGEQVFRHCDKLKGWVETFAAAD